MQYRTLGPTGIKVSHLCLGTMMLGAWGNPDHDEGEHPAVTSAIIGPRTMGQLDDLLAGRDVVLVDAALDRIDKAAPPGATVNPADNGFTPPALREAGLRRRPAGSSEPAAEW